MCVLQAGRSRVQIPMSLHSSHTTAPGLTQPLTEMSTTLMPSVSQMSSKRGILLDVSQTYRPPQPFTGIPLLFYLCNQVGTIFVNIIPNYDNLRVSKWWL
jgi:hypothetical protein